MNILLEEHSKLISERVKENVSFILIGGYAVNYHGYNRTTGDMDVWLKPDNGNKIKLLKALQTFGLDDESIAHVANLDFTHTLVFSFGDAPYKIDFLTRFLGLDYESADREKEIFQYGEIAVPFLKLGHLILTKMTTGRSRDKADVEILQQLVNQKKKQ